MNKNSNISLGQAGRSVPESQAVRELLTTLTAHARGMWRYRWRALIVMWLFSIFGAVFVFSLPPVYKANARIYVDTENALRPLLQGIAASSNVMSEVTVVTREMLSRPNLAEVARSTDLDLQAGDRAEFEELLTELQRTIQVIGSRENIYSIAFEHPDRDKAVAVVDALVNTFVEKSLGADRSESSKAQVFLRQQTTEYEARLTEAEDRLAEFKQRNVAFMPDKSGDYFSRLQSARAALDDTKASLRLAEERRGELVRQLEGEEPVFGIMPSSAQNADQNTGFNASKIRELEMQLEELRLQYTDKHPRIGQILDTIALLKEQQAEAAALEDATDGGERDPVSLHDNPVYQNMRIQLTNTEVEIASLRAELAQRQSKVEELKTLVDTVPRVEAELNRLNRDYDVVKLKYEQLLEQYETASIGEDVEQSIDDVQFRIIDPPFSELEPSGPQRPLFMTMALVISLGAGGALAFLLNQIHPVFFTGREITQSLGVPVLGSVNYLMTPMEIAKKRNDRVRFFAAVAILVVFFVFASFFGEQISPVVRDLTNAST